MNTETKSLKVFIQNNLFSISFTLLLCVWTFIVSRWGYDEIHEGQVLLGVKAIDSGLLVHRDFFEYKGLIFPYFAALLHPQSFPLVLHVRLITIFVIFSSAFIAHWYLKRVESKWTITLPVAWLLISPPIMLWSSRPWPYKVLIDPNVLSVLMMLLILALLNQDKHVRGKSFFSIWKYLCSGILLGLLPWNRIQNLIFTILIVYFVNRTSSINKIMKLTISLSSTISLLVPLVFLWINGALEFWWSQIFVIPRALADSKDTMVSMSFNQFYTTFIKFILFSFVFLLFVSIYYLVSKSMKNIFIIQSLSLLLFSFVCVVGMIALTRDINADLNNAPGNWLLIFAQWLPFSIWHFFVLCSVAIFLTFFFTKIYCLIFASKPNFYVSFTEELKMLFSAAICSVAFLYPNVGNLWSMSLPISLFVIRYFETKKGEKRIWFFQGLNLIAWELNMRRIVSLVALSAVAFLPIANSQMKSSYASQDLIYIKTNNREGVRINDEIYKLVSQIPDIPSSTYFHCPFGLATMPRQTYLPNSENWGDIVYTVPNRKNEIDYADFLVVCWTPYPDNSFEVPSDFVEIETAKVGSTKIASLFHRTPPRS